MRTCLSILLTIMLSLNASYVASAGICSVLEQSTLHVAHFGHHNHLHNDDHAHVGHIHDEQIQGDPQVNGDVDGKTATVSDHHHHHVHPSFSSILPYVIAVVPLSGSSPLVAAPHETYISASRVLPERPPRISPV